jgi:type I restriction enzyme S subunit
MIPEDWEEFTLGDVCSSISDTYDFTNKEEVFFLNTGDILNGKVINRPISKIKDLPGQAKKKIFKNDILFSEIRPANKRFAFIDFDGRNYVVSTKLMVLRTNHKIIPEFLYLFLSDAKILNHFQRLAESRSGTFPQITFDTIKRTPIFVPPKNVQQGIINLIGSIDQKGELNQQMNKTLEKIAQAIFKHWFIDFEFPDEKGRPYKSSGGEMVDSELGEIPKGWEILQLPQLASVVDCLHTKKPNRVSQDPFLLQVYNIATDGSLDLTEKYHVSSNDYEEWTKNIEVKMGDCLITNAGRVGAVAQVPAGFIGGIGRNITAIKPMSVTPTYLFRYLLSSYGLREIDRQTDHGTVLNSLNVKGIKKIRILLPSINLMNEFEEIARHLRAKVEINNIENNVLSGIRDSMLPKLMSGKIRVNMER